MNRIFYKLIAGYIGVIAILTGLILYLSFDTIRQQYVEYLIDDLTDYNRMMRNSIDADNNILSVDSLVKVLGRDVKIRYSLIEKNGRVIADSKQNIAKLDNHKSRPEVKKAFTGKIGNDIRKSKTENSDRLYVALPVYQRGKILFVGRSSIDAWKVERLIDNLERKIFRIAAVVVVGVILLAMFLAFRITDPIRKIVEAAKKVAVGEFNTKVKIKSRDEIRVLADNFNYMTEHLNYLFDKLKDEKEKVNSLIQTLHEGFIVADENGVLMMANRAFMQIVGKDDVVGKYFWELIQNENLDNYVRALRNLKSQNAVEVPINDKIYLVSANFLKGKNLFVVILHDVTKNRELETIKKDFIVNVSHELRTPLTAIKGFVETMEEENEGENLHYLEIIHRHTDRMINIVNDLLMLSSLEDENSALVPDKIEVTTYLENIFALFRQRLTDKNLTFEFKNELNSSIILADAYRLEQVFINLIDNAIKYTDAGGIEITISQTENNSIKIEIADSGIGMKQEQLTRIFERFYVVDKSRTRKMGGTGLGLSIVKHIVLLHDGTIAVESELGKGTKFIIILPQNIHE